MTQGGGANQPLVFDRKPQKHLQLRHTFLIPQHLSPNCLPSKMQNITSPWYPKPPSNELQQPPSEEIILDNGTKATKKRQNCRITICLLVLLAPLAIGFTFLIFYLLKNRGNHDPAASSVPGKTTLRFQIGQGLMSLIVPSPATDGVSFHTNIPSTGDGSDFVPYRVPPAFSMYAAVPTESPK